VEPKRYPQARDAAPSAVDDPMRGSNMLLAGTSVVSGQAKAVIVATGSATIFGKIAHLRPLARSHRRCGANLRISAD
jgi:magnesium-transporting ATPase (P-type)